MDFPTWRDLVCAYVVVVARAHGWCVDRIKASRSSRSWYLVLRCGSKRVQVRLSDHPPRGRALRPGLALLSVHSAITSRVAALPAFLRARAAS